MRLVIVMILNSLLVFWVLLVGPFCWILCDGLGPDAVESQGMMAVWRWLGTFGWGPVFGGLVVVRLTLWGLGRRSENDQEEWPFPRRKGRLNRGGQGGTDGRRDLTPGS